MDDRLSDYRHLLTEHVLHPWFPNCLDLEHGGFLSGFDYAWRPTGEHHKLLEFQARQTLAAAELLMCFPACDLLRSAVATGFAFLSGPLWDREHGGWFVCTDRSGRPRNTGDKHAHGTAYAIEACFLVSAATGDEAAAKLGKTGLEWLNKYAYDPVGGGYWGAMNRTGTIQHSGPGPQQVDHLGTPFGLKDMNVNKDVLSMLTRATGFDPSLRDDGRYDRQLDFVLRCFGEPDCPRHYIDRDGKPCSAYWKPSETVQLAGIFMEAMPQ